MRRIARAALTAVTLLSCIDPERAMRKRIAGEYVREIQGVGGKYFVRQVLSLRPDGTWWLSTDMNLERKAKNSPPDSGTYRIVGVTLNLRSLVTGVPQHYTMLGDTLFGANATMAYAMSGYDIGEDTLVRLRHAGAR